jgi:chlorite dismutase
MDDQWYLLVDAARQAIMASDDEVAAVKGTPIEIS